VPVITGDRGRRILNLRPVWTALQEPVSKNPPKQKRDHFIGQASGYTGKWGVDQINIPQRQNL
jgi:hypothetical protein